MPLRRLDFERLESAYADLASQATRQLDEDGFSEDRAAVIRLADCRYTGQGYEVRFEVAAGEIDDGWVARTEEAFHRAHEREYGQRFDSQIDIVNVRVTGVGLVPPLSGQKVAASRASPTPAFENDVVFEVDGRMQTVPTPFYDRAELNAGQTIAGPAVIEQYDSTTVSRPA